MKFNEVLIEYEYKEYCEFVDSLSLITEGKLKDVLSGIGGQLKSKINFITDLSKQLGANIKDLLILFKDKFVFTLFSKIKWSISKLFDFVKKGFNYYSQFRKAISEFIYKKGGKITKWTDELLKELDEFLKKHPILSKLGGIALGSLIIYIWFNMTFTGDIIYDFDQTTLLNAFTGKLGFADIFGGPAGVEFLFLFVTCLMGLSFPWPGGSSIQFITSLLLSLLNKAKVKLPGLIKDLRTNMR